MKVKYLGPMTAVELDGVGVVVKGQAVEVSDTLGAELIARGEWKESREARKGSD
jgi:hypothetical protein